MTSQPALAQHHDLSARLRARLQALPQWPGIEAANADRWIEAVLSHSAHLADWHIDQLFGFNAADAGALAGLEAGELHPFLSPDKIVRAKLLQDPLPPPTSDQAREMALLPQLRALYHARLASRGAAVLDNPVEHVLPEGTNWRVGSVPDIVVENGKCYLVEYQCPRDTVDTEYAIDGIPRYLQAQLHHHKAVAEAAGIVVDGLRLCSLDYRNWDVDEREVAIDQAMEVALEHAGTVFWREYVLRGQSAPQVQINRANALDDVRLQVEAKDLKVAMHDLASRKEGGKVMLVSTGEETLEGIDDLRLRIADRARRFLAWGFAESEAKKMREMLQESLNGLLPATAVPLGIDRIDTGHVRLRIDREMDEAAIITTAVELLKKNGYDEASALAYLDQPNFWQPAQFSSEALVEIMQKDLGLDPQHDPRFAAACVKGPARRLEPILEMIKGLGATEEATAGLVKGGRVRMEMPRSPLVGPLGDLRAETAAQVRRQLHDPLQAIADQYIDLRKQTEAQAKPAGRRKKPSGA